ncbi:MULTISPECIES: RNA polymerase sigma factor [Methylobacterium]|uniref:RNA polymerase sigma factor CnrH n=1 Tax=Methylobacterium thuringiense TaxID=1003091 RepID=A0ABQ4TQG9_9HYPH|nr:MULTISPECIES: RNA polymerase sigma factor [Methylobacterium]GJE57541.1 RNA polymerase sigma factor CnrH [Methylobacterium thuringiense]
MNAGAGDPDRDLVGRAVHGDRMAFEALLRRHYDGMHRIAWRMTGSREDAEDIVQEICCALADRIAGFRGEARFSTWLYGITANACRDHRRRGATLARLRQGLAVLVRAGGTGDGGDPHRRVWLASALGRLDPGLREAVVLVAGEGLTHAEAGAALGIAETTVSWRLFEARRRLKAVFDGERPDV